MVTTSRLTTNHQTSIIPFQSNALRLKEPLKVDESYPEDHGRIRDIKFNSSVSVIIIPSSNQHTVETEENILVGMGRTYPLNIQPQLPYKSSRASEDVAPYIDVVTLELVYPEQSPTGRNRHKKVHRKSHCETLVGKLQLTSDDDFSPVISGEDSMFFWF